MQRMTADQAKTQFDVLINKAQLQPVQVIDNDRVVAVMVPASDYEDMRAFYVARLIRTMARTAGEAAAAGLTQEKLDELLADES